MGNEKLINRFYSWLAFKLPKRLVYFTIIRAFAVASSSNKNSNKHPLSLTFEDLCDEWECD